MDRVHGFHVKDAGMKTDLQAAVRPVVCFAFVGAFIYTIVVGLPIEATAAVAGPMGVVIGFYFQKREV